MSLLDKPVSMNELGQAVVQDFGAVSQRKLSQEKRDLSAVWESMYEKGLQRKVSTQCYFNPEGLEIPDRHKQTTQQPKTEAPEFLNDRESAPEIQQDGKGDGQGDEESKRDLASVHLDRAMNTNRADRHNQGRSYRRKRTLSNPSKGEMKILEH